MSETLRTAYVYERRTNYILASDVYVYPSSQSDDGGDVNTEQNIRGISGNLLYKSFVVRKQKDKNQSPAPLEVVRSNSYSVHVTKGKAVVEGYFVNIKDDLDINVKDSLMQSDFDHYSSTSPDGGYVALYTAFKDIQDGHPGSDASQVIEKMKKESLYLVIELLTNSTGDVNGDYTKRLVDGIQRENHGVSLRFYTGQEIEDGSIGGDYLVLAQIVPKGMPTNDPNDFDIYMVINEVGRYMYIDWDTIVTEDGLTLKVWILNLLKGIRDRDRIVCYNSDSKQKHHEAIVAEKPPQLFHHNYKDVLEFIKYYPTSEPPSYDPVTGDMEVDPYYWFDYGPPMYEPGWMGLPGLYGYEKSYIVDMIHRRTHMSSTSDLSYYDRYDSEDIAPSLVYGYHEYDSTDEGYNHEVAYFVDQRDNGLGHHETYPETYKVINSLGVEEERHPQVTTVPNDPDDPYKYDDNRLRDPDGIYNNNGVSRLVARADHNHGLRYIFSNYSIDDGDYRQVIGTHLTVNKSFRVKSDNDTEIVDINPKGVIVADSTLNMNSLSNSSSYVIIGENNISYHDELGDQKYFLINGNYNTVSGFSKYFSILGYSNQISYDPGHVFPIDPPANNPIYSSIIGRENTLYFGDSVLVVGKSNVMGTTTNVSPGVTPEALTPKQVGVFGSENTIISLEDSIVAGHANTVGSNLISPGGVLASPVKNSIIVGNHNEIRGGCIYVLGDSNKTGSFDSPDPTCIIGKDCNILDSAFVGRSNGPSLYLGKGLNYIKNQATGSPQMIVGNYNSTPNLGTGEGNYVFIVGNGEGDGDRSNALVITAEGDSHVSNHLFVKNGIYINNDHFNGNNVVNITGSSSRNYLIVGGSGGSINQLSGTNMNTLILGTGNSISPGRPFDNCYNQLVVGQTNTVTDSSSSLVVGKDNYTKATDPVLVVGLNNIIRGEDDSSYTTGGNSSVLMVGHHLTAIHDSEGSVPCSVVMIGKYNDDDIYGGGHPSLVIGDGLNDSNRSNSFSVDDGGNTYIRGKLKVESNYIVINNVRVYIASIAPADTDIPNGSLWVGGGSSVKTYSGGTWS